MTAKEFGARAWANGIPCSPYLDAEFMKMDMGDENYSKRLKAYRAWTRGWTEANLKDKENESGQIQRLGRYSQRRKATT